MVNINIKTPYQIVASKNKLFLFRDTKSPKGIGFVDIENYQQTKINLLQKNVNSNQIQSGVKALTDLSVDFTKQPVRVKIGEIGGLVIEEAYLKNIFGGDPVAIKVMCNVDSDVYNWVSGCICEKCEGYYGNGDYYNYCPGQTNRNPDWGAGCAHFYIFDCDGYCTNKFILKNNDEIRSI